MEEILGWPPILWTARVFLLIALFVAAWVAALYLLRYFRCSNIKELAAGRLPSIKSLGFLGQKVELQSKISKDIESQVSALEGRVTEVEDKHRELSVAFHRRQKEGKDE